MATYRNGFGGSLQYASATLDVLDWTLDADNEKIETTNTGDSGWKSYIVGADGWTGNANAFFDTAAFPTGSAGFKVGTTGTITLTVSGTGKSYTGTVILDKVTVKNSTKGGVTFALTFCGTGALVYAS